MPDTLINILRAVKRRLDYTEKGRVRRLIEDPPAIQEDLIVFTSSDDYTGNPKALFLYLIDNGYNEKYRMICKKYDKRTVQRTEQ